MPRGPKGQKRPADVIGAAVTVAKIATGEVKDSKKIENHCYALALYFVWYNFVRIHKSLRVTPAMAAGVTDTLRDMEWIVSLIDERAPKSGPRGSYKKRTELSRPMC